MEMSSDNATPGIDADQLVTEDWRLNRTIFDDPLVFDAEMSRVYQSSWVFLCHESEIAEPGDYRSCRIGHQPVLVTRDSDDEGLIHAFINRCRHRGSIVCQFDKGNANAFRCPYHGWTYRNDGSLVGVPFADGYGDSFQKGEWGLIAVPKVATYRGFIFGNLNPEAPSLQEYLGEAAQYLDVVADQGPSGIELTAGVQRYRYAGNWKLQVENTVDPYHVAFVHQGYLQIVGRRTNTKSQYVKNLKENPSWVGRDLGNGHSVQEYGEEGPGVELGDLPFNLLIFPNLGFVGVHLRVIQPVGPELTHVSLYPMMLKDVPSKVNAKRLRDHEGFYGPAGFGGPDDVEMFSRVGRGLEATKVEWLLVSRGIHRETSDDRGVVSAKSSDELPIRAFYREWKKRIVRGTSINDDTE